jgi:hypothetical protein
MKKNVNELTGTDIVAMLRTNDHAVARALVVLYERQTEDEKSTEHTRHHNNRGFRPCHAKMGTSMAKFYLARGFLTPKQIAYWRKEGKEGMRLSIYWRQLLDAAHKKAAAKAAAAEQIEREMQKIEAEGDRLQTILEENNKLAARIQMEKNQMMGAGA